MITSACHSVAADRAYAGHWKEGVRSFFPWYKIDIIKRLCDIILPSPPVGGAQPERAPPVPVSQTDAGQNLRAERRTDRPPKVGGHTTGLRGKTQYSTPASPRMIPPVRRSPRHSLLWHPQRGTGLSHNFIAIPYDYVQISCPHRYLRSENHGIRRRSP